MHSDLPIQILIIAPRGSLGDTNKLSQISDELAIRGNRIIFAEQHNHYLCSLFIDVIIDITNKLIQFEIGAILSGVAYDVTKGLFKTVGNFIGGYSINLKAFGKDRLVNTPSDDEKEAARLILEALTEMYEEMQSSETSNEGE